MLDYSNADHESLTWDGAAQMVVDGTAAMTMVGDFAKGFFLTRGWRSGVELAKFPSRAPPGPSCSSSTRSVCPRALPTVRRR